MIIRRRPSGPCRGAWLWRSAESQRERINSIVGILRLEMCHVSGSVYYRGLTHAHWTRLECKAAQRLASTTTIHCLRLLHCPRLLLPDFPQNSVVKLDLIPQGSHYRFHGDSTSHNKREGSVSQSTKLGGQLRGLCACAHVYEAHRLYRNRLNHREKLVD